MTEKRLQYIDDTMDRFQENVQGIFYFRKSQIRKMMKKKTPRNINSIISYQLRLLSLSEEWWQVTDRNFKSNRTEKQYDYNSKIKISVLL